MEARRWDPQIEVAPIEMAPDGRRARAKPLSMEERRYAAQVARRLLGELRPLVASLPDHARGASGMARYLKIARNTCQRTVACLGETDPGADVLARLPGVQGLRQLLDAMRKKGADIAEVDGAGAAVEQFERLIKELAGSQTRLGARLDATNASASAGSTAADTERQRMHAQLFAAAAGVTGRRCETFLSMYAFRPDQDDPTKLERILVKGLIGQVARPDAIPLSLNSGNTQSDESMRDQAPFSSMDRSEARGLTPRAVVEAFSTTPVPVVTSRGARGQLYQIIDPTVAPDGPPIDVVVANRSAEKSPRPESQDPPVLDIWVLTNTPSRYLLFDVYLHREMARSCIPSLDAQLWQPNLDSPLADRWLHRLPDQPRLEMLNQDISRVGCLAYGRMVELTRYMFDTVGWNPTEFVGFRCLVSYPVWRAGYRMAFDFSGETESGD